MKALLKRVYARVPAFVKKDGARVALLFGAAFVMTAKPLVPHLLSSPSLSNVKALMVAGLLAGVRSAEPVVVKLGVEIAYKIVQHVEAKKPVTTPGNPPVEVPAPLTPDTAQAVLDTVAARATAGA